MLKTLQNAFKIKDVRRRIFYVFLMVVVIRIGSQLPIPGVDPDYFKIGLQASPTMRLISSTHLQAAPLQKCQSLH